MVTMTRYGMVLAWLLSGGTLAAQDNEGARERWQRVPDVLEALGVGSGMRVADVGAGGGFFTARLAAAVGRTGRVFAIDVDAGVVDRLRQRAAREEWSNVEIIHSAADDPRLPRGSVDAVLIVNAYHEFTRVAPMLAGLAAALRPGGRVVIIDQVPTGGRLRAERPAQEQAHELGSWFAVRDLTLAGYRIVRLEDPFIAAGDAGAREPWWLLVGVRGEP